MEKTNERCGQFWFTVGLWVWEATMVDSGGLARPSPLAWGAIKSKSNLSFGAGRLLASSSEQQAEGRHIQKPLIWYTTFMAPSASTYHGNGQSQ